MIALMALGPLPHRAVAASPAATAAAFHERIGTWILTCGSGLCAARHKDPLFDRAGVTATLELRAGDDGIIPAIVLRGPPDRPVLTSAVSSAIAGMVRVSMQMGSAAPADLACLPDEAAYVCAPGGDAARRLAAALPDAASLTIRITAAQLGHGQNLSRSKSVQLNLTRRALVRLRAGGSLSPAGKPQAPTGWTELVDKAMKAAGYREGQADLQTLVARYLGR